MSSSASIHEGVPEAGRGIKTEHAYRFVTFKFTDDLEQIVVEEKGEREVTYDAFVAALPQDQVRFALYDFETTTADDRSIAKIVLIAWTPDSAPLKEKMLLASSREALKDSLGIAGGIEIQATHTHEIGRKAIEDQVLDSSRD
ncbi:actin-binding ADF family protein [Streptomyces xanthochromogenes]|uniref:ADF-H domain-containing protein n=1 Tax=Streptomyces xanthochromogenes TaxID=67384 RepID=A0ABQ2ZIG2_9ACTN|nr:actin depolymerization factor/cofilin-like domain-containing protein [Streptomyces xanthochromogenes]GGY14331.1 hypothetical protein GCM10010326_02200 [Streptomyces xanthochromogenes]